MAQRLRPSDMARLLMKHRTALYAYVFACVHNHNDVEDILQNVSVAVIESYRQLRSEDGFLTWAREIARRRILAYRRGTKREQAFDPELVRSLAEAAEELERLEPASHHHVALLACLESLPAESRKIIIARYSDRGGDASQLAERFGYSIQSIYARIKRIKIALRQCVEKRLTTEPE